MRTALAEAGPGGFVHGNRGRALARRTAPEVRSAIIAIRTAYGAVNDSHFLSRKAIDRLELTEAAFAAESEMQFAAAANGLRLGESPITIKLRGGPPAEARSSTAYLYSCERF